MKRKPTTDPQIDGKPMSFVKLKSMAEDNPLIVVEDGRIRQLVNGEYSDARDVPYIVKDGTVYRVRKEKTVVDADYRD